MEISRRDLLAGAGGTLLLPWSSEGAAALADPSYSAYASTLVGGYTPQWVTWKNIRWKSCMGSVWNQKMDYAWRVTPNKSRFELHNTPLDRGKSDSSTKRRCEIHANHYRLPNSVPLWGAYSFIDHAWADPAGMSRLQGGAHAQMHMPEGGSPAFAFRRDRDGNFLVTTSGANDATSNNKRYKAALSFGQVHDIVFRAVIHPVRGELDVWLDRRQILKLRNVSIGAYTEGCYWCIGLYYTGGICCPIISQRANHVFPSTTSLSSRTITSPKWPST